MKIPFSSIFTYCLPFLISFFILLTIGGIFLIFTKAYRKFFFRYKWGRVFFEGLKKPLFSLAILFSMMIMAPFWCLNDWQRNLFHHLFIIAFLINAGWLFLSLSYKFYLLWKDKLHAEKKNDREKRAALTQLLFLYRFIVFILILIFGSSILMTFPSVKSLGVGLLSSAGILGIVLGIAGRPILLNLMAGFQIALGKTIQIGDTLWMEGEVMKVESIRLTHLIARVWDGRRMVIPISFFIDRTFQNWDLEDSSLIGTILLYCDWKVNIEALRKKGKEIAQSSHYWDGKCYQLDVTNCTEKTIEIRILVSAEDSQKTFDLRCYVREKLIEFLREYNKEAQPHERYTII